MEIDLLLLLLPVDILIYSYIAYYICCRIVFIVFMAAVIQLFIAMTTTLFTLVICAFIVNVNLSQPDRHQNNNNVVMPVKLYPDQTIPRYNVEGTAKSSPKVIFRENTEGFAVYRLPATVYHKDTFLVFCEGRLGSADSSVSRIVMKRGLQNGTTVEWDKTLTVVARINGTRLANPVPIVDNVTDTIFVAYNVLPAHVPEDIFLSQDHYNQSVLLIKSTDLGKTWSDPQNITQETLGQIQPPPSFYAPGPGHGIQMQSGRLVLQGNFYRKDKNETHKTYKSGTSDHATVFLSDNHGKNWRPGGYVPYSEDKSGKPIHTSESTVVELANNTLCINSRTLEKTQPRSQSFSTDGGETFGLPQLNKALPEPENPGVTSGCEASVWGFPAPHNITGHTIPTSDAGQPWVLFSNPADSIIRIDMSIRLSTDGCQTWSDPWSLWPLGSGYSDLVQYEITKNNVGTNVGANVGKYSSANNGPMFAIVFEGGYIDTTSSVTFQMFSLKDVLDGVRASEIELETNQIVS